MSVHVELMDVPSTHPQGSSAKNMSATATLQELLAQAGVSKIIYALVTPETEAVVDRVLDGTAADGRERYHHMFREAWTQKQDAVHEAFFEEWVAWTAPIVQWNAADFPYRYPLSGASEGLREAIHAYGARARSSGFEPTIHIFEGEYEGYAAYARAASIPCEVHPRSQWRQAIQSVRGTDQWYLSHPSAIDGLVWNDYDAFVQELAERSPRTQLMLDLTYVGCVARPFQVRASYPNIATIFFSLSKPAGVYYHRIGGMFAREEYLGLFGNKWFKNLTSLAIGTEFMRQHDVYALPRRYRAIQERVLVEIREELGLRLQPADVMLLGVGAPNSPPSALETFLMRGARDEVVVRVCLTPRMAHHIDPKLNPTVQARTYERLS